MKNAWKPGRQAKAAAGSAFFITDLAPGFNTSNSQRPGRSANPEVFSPPVNWAMKTAMLAAAFVRLSAFERFSSPCFS
jgi:hypothetical protein